MIRKFTVGFFAIFLFILVATIMYGIHLNNQFFRDAPNRLIYAKDTSAIEFQWAQQQYGDHIERYTAMVIPTSIAGTRYKIYFQMDTGSPHSYIYGKTLSSLREIGVAMGIDTLAGRILKDLHLTLGGSEIAFEEVSIMESFGREVIANDTVQSIMLGTIGADFLDQRITSIDFKNQKIHLYDERPQWMNRIESFTAFDFRGRRIMLPTTVGDKQLELLYDSGCSAFGLITSKKRYLKYSAPDQKEVSYQGSRWGDALPIYHKSSRSMLQMGGSAVPLARISYVDMYGDFQHFMTPFTSIGGFLGNMPFLDHVLILDTQSKQFAVVKSL